MDQLIQTVIIGLANGLIFALVALGYTLVYGIIELINFAHGDVFMLGSMLAFFLIAPTSSGGTGIFPITTEHAAPAHDRRDPRHAADLHGLDGRSSTSPSSGSPTDRCATPPSSPR